MKLCFATNNLHKLSEVKQLLQATQKQLEVLTLQEIGCEEELPETSDTIEGNSLQKAQYVWQHYGVNCFADDSGLEIEALNNAPGVHSAHYSGSRDYNSNMAKVLEEMADKTHRIARFKTVITLILEGKVFQFLGIVEGKILEKPIGNEGFGYDPIFLPDGYQQTFAQMTLTEKSRISHRAKAFEQLVQFLSQS
ncbi:MAG: RdgB/HAM1 family non-canonical purine NTP pyrophosphatase [Runella sp.]